MNIKNLNGIVGELDYHIMWYKWITSICPTPKEIYEFNKMNKDDQLKYLEDKVNV